MASRIAWSAVLARRRNRWLLALLVLVVAVRVALPYVLRRVAVTQADAALVGRIELDDVDLSLLTGSITLHGLRVFASEAPPSAGEGAAADTPPPSAGNSTAAADAAPPSADDRAGGADATPPSAGDGAAGAPATPPTAGEGEPGAAPVFSATRLAVQFGYVALLRKIIDVQRFELEGFAVSLDRAANGTLVVPAPVPAPEAAPPPANAEGSGWGVLIERVALRDGRFGFRDFAVGEPPQHITGTLPALDAGHLALLLREGGVEPGTVALEAGVADGTLRLTATLEHLAAGPAYESHVTIANLPIGDARAYIPRLGWTDLAGRLDVDLVHRFESQGAHTLHGALALRDVAVRVKDLDEPALAWSRLAVEVTGIDLAAQNAVIGTVTLADARVVTRPAGPEPLPVLRGLTAAAESTAPAAARASPTALPAEPSAAPAAPSAARAGPMAAAAIPSAAPAAPSAAPTPARADAATRPWTWRVEKIALTDARVHALGGDAPLDVGVAAEVAGVASAPATRSRLHLALAPATGGSVAVDGDFATQPIAFDGTLRADGVVLAPLTQPVATTATRLLRNGVATLALQIAAGATAQAPADGVRVAGTIGVRDLDVASEDPKPFALRWKDLTLELREVTAPGIFAAAAREPASIGVAMSRFSLVRPEIVATRTESGLALPAALGAAPAPAASAPPGAAVPTPAVTPAAAAASPAPLDVQVRIDKVAIEKMRVGFNDEAVRPFYRSEIDPLDLTCADLRWPGPFAKDVRLVAKGLGGATCKVTGDVAPAGSRLQVTLAGLPLAPFNPYAAASGYGVAGGTARLDSTIDLRPDAYQTTSKLVLNRLQVTGSEGDALFASQFGMPLSLALGLLTDLEGNIVLDLPISGDAAGMHTGLGTIVGNALARAILNAVTSPLKLVGAVTRLGEKPATVTPSPIVFAPGRDAVAPGEEQKLDQLASLLAAAPGLKLHLRGETAAEDRRWLQEQALRAKLESESGVVGSLRHITERGARAAALTVLSARAEGKAADIPEEHKEWFEAQVAAQSVADDALRALAAARAEKARARLASTQGIAAERVVLDEVTPPDLAARPVVAVGLGAPAPRTPTGETPPSSPAAG